MQPLGPLVWTGGEHPFALSMGEIEALQQATGFGPHRLLTRMVERDWMVGEIKHTIRLGLIGGGMAQKDAGPIVARLFDEHPLFEFLPLATMILQHALSGPEDDPVGKPRGVETPPTPTTPES